MRLDHKKHFWWCDSYSGTLAMYANFIDDTEKELAAGLETNDRSRVDWALRRLKEHKREFWNYYERECKSFNLGVLLFSLLAPLVLMIVGLLIFGVILAIIAACSQKTAEQPTVQPPAAVAPAPEAMQPPAEAEQPPAAPETQPEAQGEPTPPAES